MSAPDTCYKTKEELAAENDLLRAQLIQCTTTMRGVATWIREKEAAGLLVPPYLGFLRHCAETLEKERGAPVVVVPSNALNAYQHETRRTASRRGDKDREVTILALGLCGEAGEVVELVKKFIGHGVPFELDKLKKELGDVLWYLARLADEHGIALQDVADANVAKLRARYPNGMTQGGGKRDGEAA